MIYTIIIEPEALEDLQNIFTYIKEQDTEGKAAKFLLELQKNIASLETMPHRCRKSVYSDDLNTRDLIYKGYTVVFQVLGDRVHALTLFRQKEF